MFIPEVTYYQEYAYRYGKQKGSYRCNSCQAVFGFYPGYFPVSGGKEFLGWTRLFPFPEIGMNIFVPGFDNDFRQKSKKQYPQKTPYVCP